MSRLALALIGVLVLLWTEPVVGKGEVTRLAYPLALFANVDIDDAQAAVDVWIDALATEWGLPYGIEATVFEDTAELAMALAAGELDVVALFPLDYLQVRDQVGVKPVLSPAYGGEMVYRSVVLVRRDRGVAAWAGLAGGELIIARASRGELGRLWMDVELMRQELGESEMFFRRIKEVDKTSQAVLPVFLGNADACLVPQEQFATMVELNPQLGRELVALAVSPAVGFGVVCLRPDFDPARWAELESYLLQLHNQALGRQIFDVFHYGRLVLFDPAYIENAISLVEEYKALRAKAVAE